MGFGDSSVLVVLVLVVVFVVGVFIMLLNQKSAFERGHPRECFSDNKVSQQMLAAGADPYAIRKLAGALAVSDPAGWEYSGKAPVTVVGPVGDGWKKALTMQANDVSYGMLDAFLSFQHAVFIFGAANFMGELFVLPLETASEAAVEFGEKSHRQLLNTNLKWLAPARMLSVIVPPKRVVVFELQQNVPDVIIKEGSHASISIIAPIKKIIVKKLS
jgi:hypothetical protein